MLHYQQSKPASSVTLSTCCLYLLFITFIAVRPIWHYFESSNILPRLSFPIITTVGIGLLVLLNVWHFKTAVRVHKAHLASLALLSLVILLQFIAFPWASQYAPDGVLAYRVVIFSTMISPILMWLSGANIDKFFNLLKDNRSVKVFICLLYIAFVTTIIYGIYSNPLPPSVLSFHIYAASGADYLMLSDAFAVFTLLIISIIKVRWLKIGVALLGTVLLVATLSRTSLYFYTFTMLLLLILNSKHRWPLITVLVIVTGVAWLQMDSSTLSVLGESRMFRVLVDLSEDQSLQDRGMLLEQGFKDISNYWLLGSFMQEFADSRPGGYVHNWLSFFIAYGVVPFLMFVGLSVVLVWNITHFWLRSPNNEILTFVFAVTIFTFLSIILARAYTYPYIWFTLAAIPTAITHFQQGEKLKP